MKSNNGSANAEKRASNGASGNVVVNNAGKNGHSSQVKKAENSQRYSDDDLAEFKVIILDKLEKAEKEYKIFKQAISSADNNGTEDTSPTHKGIFEEGAASAQREEDNKQAGRQQKFIQNLKAALIRVENKTYGICRETGKLISKERLKVVPHATLSIESDEKSKGISPQAMQFRQQAAC